jgi:hypothetical protein
VIVSQDAIRCASGRERTSKRPVKIHEDVLSRAAADFAAHVQELVVSKKQHPRSLGLQTFGSFSKEPVDNERRLERA